MVSWPRTIFSLTLLACLLLAGACSRPTPAAANSAPPQPAERTAPAEPGLRLVRGTGTIQSVRALTIQAPQIMGQGRMTLMHIVDN